MQYDEATALSIIKKFGYADSVMRRWKHLGRIPDQYADPNYKPLESLDRKGIRVQERVMKLVKHPLIKRTAFDGTTKKNKLREMITLRNGFEQGRRRAGRNHLPTLSLSKAELEAVVNQLLDLSQFISKELDMSRAAPFATRQNILRDCIRGRKELTNLQCVIDLDRPVQRRWEAFCGGRIEQLRDDEVFIVEHIERKLDALASEIIQRLQPQAVLPKRYIPRERPSIRPI